MIVLGVIAYALQGGEYGTTDLMRQRAKRRAMMAEIDTLERQVDSLSRLKKRLDTDAALQERVARDSGCAFFNTMLTTLRSSPR